MFCLRRFSRRRIASTLVLTALAAVGATVSAQPQVVPGTNVNMVSGTTFPDGDPYLQRQNEPSSAVSTRNPLHILAGSNDYRTVDLPGPFDPLRGFKMNADAWVGLFKSLNGGQTWTSTLVPGYPQDISPEGLASPIKGREASTDPVMRAGTNGLFYYAGVAFDRGQNKPSAIFMARYTDLNNLEAGDPFGYVDTRIVDADGGGRFLDKPAVATDIPRGAATCSITSRQSNGTTHVQTIPAGNVYVAYSAFTGQGATEQSVILFSRSTNCGATWSAPKTLSTGSRLVQNAQIAVSPTDGAVYVSWRRFKYQTQDDAVMLVKSVDGGVNFSKILRVSGVRPFDQGTTSTSFRTNGFQTMAIDGTGRVYIAWPERGFAAVRSDPVSGDSRIVISTSATGSTWTVPRPVQTDGVGHQLMPALTFHGGKLRLLYYDLREDVSQLFGPFIDELPILNGAPPRIRHTIDVFVAQALPGSAPAFTTARVSDYARGFMPGSTIEERLQFNPPNLPLFQQGAVPFMGDYIDLAPAPPFVLNDAGVWVHNVAPSGSTVSHAFWADNRDVRAPADGNWANYTPVTSDALGTQSRYDPSQMVPPCSPGQVGMRNQNIYTARVTDGLFVSAPGNNKTFNGFQRAFVVVAENATAFVKTYRLRIEDQPIGGQASFLQFGLLNTLDVTTPILSSIARTVFVTSQDEDARIRVSLTEITAPGGAVVAGGLTGSVILNPDPDNPSLQNPSLQNPSLQNPLISEGEAYNPSITSALVGVPSLQNPSLQNPSLQNPSLQNPSIQNPHLQNPSLQNPSLQNPTLQNDAVANPSIVNAGVTNPSLQNPSLQNPSLQNPSIQNVDLTNAGFSDTNWVLTNEGNTTASYTVNLLLNEPPPAGFATQLILHKTFKTPAADGCTLKEQAHTILLANIPNPQFVTDPTNPSLQNPSLQNPSLQNPTLALGPGESATITFRVVDPNIFDGVTYDAAGAVTPAAVAQSVNSEDVATPGATPQVAIPMTITTTAIPPTSPGAPISRTLQSVFSTGALVCTVVSGQLPPGVTLSSGGTISGTPTTPGNYVFTVRCTDAAGRADEQTLSVQVDPAAPVSFDALWNGADTNWYNPANWSPRGVPTAASRVYVSAATTTVPRLTANVTLRDLFLEPGATLDTNGFTLTVTNNADAGHTIIGQGRTVLTGDGGTASGVFANLEIRGRIMLTAPLTTTGTLTLGAGARLELNGQALIVGGQLITSVTEGALPVIVGAAGGANGVFLAAGVNVDGLVIEGVPLTINAGALTRFDNVSFSGFSPDAVQLTVSNPGLITHFPMNGVSFSTTPTTGQYVQVNDTLDAGPTLIVDILGAVPADGSALTGTSGGALVNWIPNPGEANLAVTQTVAPVPSAAGTRLTYTITVTNGGPVAATQVTLIPGVPIGATGTTTSTTQGACTLGSGGWSCALGNLPSGSVAVTEVSFIPATTGTLFTTASVTSQTPDSVIANNFHTIAASIVPAGQGVSLALTKTDSIDPVAVNAPFTYTLTATNAGSTLATNVVVTDHVPAGVTITYATSPSGMCSAISSQVLCSFAALEPGQSVTMTFNATATATGVVTNQAVVTSAEVELTPADNIATQTTVVGSSAPPSADLSVTLSDSADPVTLGQPFSYVLVVHNSGAAPATGVVVTDTLPVGVTASSAVSTLGSCTIGDRTITCAIGTLAAGGSATVTIGVSGVVAGLVTNSASIAGAQLDPVPGNNTDTEDTTLTLAACAVPSFSAPVALTLPTYDSLFTDQADLNGDGARDLVVSLLPGGLVVRLNNGDGSFAAAVPVGRPAPVPGDVAPRGFALRDLNGDGRIDIAVATGTTLDVLIGAGDGTFAAPVTYPLGATEPISVGAADLDNDGDFDLVLDSLDDDDPFLQVYRNAGNGTFAAAQLVTMGALEPGLPTIADFNGDGLADFAAGSWQGVISIVLADGNGGYLAPITYTTPGGSHPVVAGDIDGDGDTDLTVYGDGSEDLRLWLGQGNGQFTRGPYLGLGATARGTRLVDVNHDGRADLVTAHPSLGTVAVALAQGGGTFAAPTHYASPFEFNQATLLDDGDDISGWPMVADFNGDGQLDIAMANPAGSINMLFSRCGEPLADLSVTVQDSPDPVTESATVTYTVTVVNNGPSTASNGAVNLSVGGVFEPNHPSIAHFVDVTGAAGCTRTEQHAVCVLPALAPGASATIQAMVTPAAATTMTLSASAASDAGDPTPANNTAFETTTVAATGRNLVVTNTNDSGPGSLRQAIVESNSDSGDRDTIVFNIPGSGVPTITLQDGLGAISQPVVIDGTTQPGAGRVELNGNGLTATGLVVQGGNSIVRGLAINRFGFDAISLEVNGGNVVEGNFLGTDPTGMLARPNGGSGVRVSSAANRIGGLTSTARNVISGNQGTGVTLQNSTATGNVVQGNYIGITAAGLAALPNTNGGVNFFNGATANTIGGAVSGAGNVISGNTGHGINVTSGSNGNTIQGNFIGLDAAGNTDRGNTGDGINIAGVSGTIVGGTTSGARNVVSGNNNVGIRINGAAATGNQIRGNYVGVNVAGAAAVGNTNGGITVQNSASGNTIGGSGAGEGNVISGNNTNGISLQTGANNNTIQGNAVGVDPAGTFDLGNSGNGIHVNGVTGTIIGGTSATARNIVSGNNGGGIRLSQTGTRDTTVAGNYVGVDAAGNLAIANGGPGIVLETGAHDNTIGGTAPGAGNLVSGNALSGITLMGAGVNNNVVHGNRIGTDALVTTAIPNLSYGVNIADAADNVVGGSGVGARNIISGNRLSGVFIGGTGNAATGNIVLNNFIGTNGSGMSGIGNGEHGVLIQSAAGNSIGAAGAGNVISGNVQNGIAFFGSTTTGNTVSGNRIGTNVGATQSVANGADGIRIDSASTNTIGGRSTGAGNIVAGNTQHGIAVYGAATGNQIIGNVVGLREPPNVLGNALDGIQINNGSNNTIGGLLAGEANTVAWNGRAGVTVLAGTGNRILSNRIFAHSGRGIDLLNDGLTANDSGDGDTGPNNLQNFPVLTSAVGGVQGTLHSTGGTAFTIQFFGNTSCNPLENGQGEQFLGSASVTTNASGVASIPFFAAAEGQLVTATATDPGGNTSEFSVCSAGLTVRTWVRDGDGFWEDAANWSGGQAPQPGENVVIDRPAGDFTVTVQSANVTLERLTSNERLNITGGSLAFNSDSSLTGGVSMSGGFVGGAGNLLLGGTSLWTGGQISGSGQVVVSAGATLTVSAPAVAGSLLRSIENHGRLIWNQPSLALNGRNIVNRSAGSFEIQTNLLVSDAGDLIGTLRNEGRLFKTGAVGAVSLRGANFVNTGLLELRVGDASDAIDSDTQVTLGGTLSVLLDESVVPSLGQEFEVLRFGSRSGAFANLNGNGQSYQLEYTDGGAKVIARGGVFTNFDGWQGAAAGTLRTIDFESRATGTLLTGSEYEAIGATILQRNGHPMRIVSADDGTFASPANFNSQSRGLSSSAAPGFPLGFDDSRSENYDFVFGTPVRFGGLWIGHLNPGNSTVTVQFLDGAGDVLHAAPLSTAYPHLQSGDGGQFDNRLFVGVLSNTPVKTIRVLNAPDDGDGIVFDDVVFYLDNVRPIANAGPDQTSYVGRLVTLDGSGSDAEGDDLTYAWSFTARPTGSQAALSNATMPSPSFTPDLPGTYTAELIVNDGTDSSVADAVTITVLTNEIALALVGAQVVGVTREAPVRVTLPFAAPSGGTTVTLTSAQPGFLSVVAPGTAFIAEGQTVGQIMVRGEGSGTALLRANAAGYGQGTLSVLVTHNLISTPSTLNVAFGGSTALPINIGPDPAPAGGLTLDVVSSDANIEVLTPQVTVAAGALSVNATVRGARVGTANVTVSNPNYAPSTTVVTSRAELNIVQTSASFNQGLTPPTLTLRLESNGTQIAAQPALTVTLTAANTGCVTVPSSVTIPAGLVSTSFSPAYGGSATLPCTTTVTASATDVTPDTVSITVNRPAAINAGGPVPVGAGLMSSASATVSAAQHGGVDVTIAAGTEAQPGPVRLSRTATEVGTQSITVHLNNGQTSIPYYVHGLENTTGSSTITLSAEGLTGDSHTVDVVQPGVEIHNLTASMNTLSGSDTDVYVQVGITHPSYNNSQLWQAQSVRPGGAGFEVTLANSNSSVARLRSDEPAATGGQTGQVVKKTIPAGAYYTHAITTGTTFGFAFEPLGTGTTTVTVTAPGAVTMTTTGVRQVQVTSPVINAGGTVMVGAGLIEGASATVSAAQHGGVDVTITAGTEAQPGPVRLSRTATEVGTQSITVHLNNGQTSIPYYVHGLENTTGSSTITLAAERFASDSHTVDVVQPGVEIHNLSASMNTLSGPDTDVYVQVGITHPSYNNSQLWQAQSVRPGGRGFEVTLTNGTSSVARLRSDEPAATGGQTGQVVRKTIPAGTYYTHAIATGTTFGFAFEPLGTGTTTVTVTAPGAVTMTTTGVRQVQVTSPVINAGGTVMVGAGLIEGASAFLSAAQHGGVDVTITAGTVAQPGPVRLSRTATEVGTQSITVHLNNGQTSIPYYVHGLENTTGSSTITLTAERFTSDAHTVDVVEAGVEIHNLSGSFTNLSADDTDVYVQVGITHPSYNNSQLWQVQNVRPGSSGVEVTLTNSNVNVARLRSDEPAATGGQTGQVVKKTIPAGTYYTHAITTGTTYGFAFEPLSNGATTVTVTAPRARTMTTTGVRQVTVTTPAISVADTATIGAGLMDSMNATLGATQHGGVDVTITSSAPSVVLVSPATTTAGTASTVVRVANNQNSVPFVIHGLENVSATAVVTLSAPGFTSTTMSVTVTPSSVEILNLSPSISAGGADDTDVYVQVGITHPSYNNSQLWQVQTVRAGSPGFVVTLTVDNPARAQLRSDEPQATGHTVTKPIRPGNYYTQRLIQSGTTYGLAFDPLAQGTVVVTATGPPGTLPLDSSQRSVVINP